MRNRLDIQLTKNIEEAVREFRSLSSPQNVAAMLEIPYNVLNFHLYITRPNRQYKTFSIAKKSGGVREICAPVTPIKIIQQKLNSILQNLYKDIYARKFSVHGFIYGKSVRTNAQIHTRKEYVFNIDLLDFFPSINFGRVRGMFMNKPYNLPQKVSTVLARICCFKTETKDFLPQGAPTSPIISNMICARMDDELYRLARRFECKYTRYADDITFSTNRPNFPKELAITTPLTTRGRLKAEVGKELNDIIRGNGFSINTSKVWIQHRNSRQKVTGLIVNEFPNVSRKYTNQVRAMLHAWGKYGLKAAEKEFLDKYERKKRWVFEEGTLFKQVVKGRINFLKMVRGDQSPVYQKFCEKLASLDTGYSFIKIIRETDPAQFQQAVFVLESPIGQGTAFMLYGIGLVTSAHNLQNDRFDTVLSKVGTSPDKHNVKVRCIKPDLDVAIIEVRQGWAKAGLVRGDSTILKTGDTVKVIGFPNHAKGKSIHIYDGKITGRGRWFKVKTLNVSARIIYGNSGGPVLNDKNEVIGIAFYGAPNPEKADCMESAVIPIEVLDKLV